MSAAIQAIITLIAELVPAVSANSALWTKILEALISLVPLIIKEYQDLLPAVKNIISALSANPPSDADQLKALQVLDAQVDAAFEAAATKAIAEDNGN